MNGNKKLINLASLHPPPNHLKLPTKEEKQCRPLKLSDLVDFLIASKVSSDTIACGVFLAGPPTKFYNPFLGGGKNPKTKKTLFLFSLCKARIGLN
jgi:hypothetical protein